MKPFKLAKICVIFMLVGCSSLPVSHVLSQAERDKMTPEDVLESLKAGNKRFVDNNLTIRNNSKLVRDAATGQFPKAVILSCLDSRIPVEEVFDMGIGDVFVARVAGNFANTDILGSMEFGCKLTGSKLILVLGHEDCGAIKGAIDNAKLGNLTATLANIRPAVEHCKNYQGEKTSKNVEFTHLVAVQNVRETIKKIRKKSPILKKLEQEGKLKIIGGMYNMDTGKVTFMNK